MNHLHPPRVARDIVSILALAILVAIGTSACAPGDGVPSGSTPGVTSSAPVTPTKTTPSPAPSVAPLSCGDPGGTAPVVDGYPQRLSSLYGLALRTGGHPPCFERVVVEFGGSGPIPGYRVQYVTDPVKDYPRGEPVPVRGDATLVLSMGSWMPQPDGSGYDGPTDIVPTNVKTILELRRIENFEGVSAWAIGLDHTRRFTVSTLQNPARIVIDITLP